MCRRWVVWFHGFSAHVSFASAVVIRWSAVGFGFGYVTAVSDPSVSAVVSVTAITRLQLRRHFRLRPKPEKVVSVGHIVTMPLSLTVSEM